jgi:hypothetical protein
MVVDIARTLPVPGYFGQHESPPEAEKNQFGGAVARSTAGTGRTWTTVGEAQWADKTSLPRSGKIS